MVYWLTDDARNSYPVHEYPIEVNKNDWPAFFRHFPDRHDRWTSPWFPCDSTYFRGSAAISPRRGINFFDPHTPYTCFDHEVDFRRFLGGDVLWL